MPARQYGAAGVLIAVLASSPAAAQQGSVQVSGAAQATTGEISNAARFNRVEPDFGVMWYQPGTRLGTIRFEARGTERQQQLHPGRIYGSVRDLKFGDWKWTIEAGDAFYAPTIGDYKFSNLYTPAVTYAGAAVAARSARTEWGVVAGRGTVWRNIFGSDPDTLGQSLAGGRFARQLSDRIDVNVRGSHVRTTDLNEFTYAIGASDQAGGGVRFVMTPSLQVIADSSLVWYQRAGSNVRERDPSGLVGLHWLHSRGWLQVNASRFSPGESPTLNSPLPDRAGQFATGEFDLLRRLRVFGGWEQFRSNLDPSAALAAGFYQLPRTSGIRQFGGVRIQVGPRSTLTLRADAGDRVSRYVVGTPDIQSDTGSWTVDWQTALNHMNGYVRVSERDNVNSVSRSGSFTQRDVAGQLFVRVRPSLQFFGLGNATRTDDEAGGSSTYWQAGGGGQLQVVRQGLWMRSEATFSRNADLMTRTFVPRESLSVGLNGYVARHTSIGFDLHVDRMTIAAGSASPWATRSTVRIVQTLPTGSPYAVSGSGLFRTVPTRAIGTVKGTVFTDWNGNGLREPGEDPVAGVPMRLTDVGAVETGKSGEFVFRNVPDGIRDVAIDVGTLPVDFNPPAIARVQVALSGNDIRQVAFGLIPLGAIRGRVVRDVNSNGVADSAEPAVDGAVVVLDGGQRSERSKKGRFAFEAVPSGEHTVTLLAESLPDGAMIAGEPTLVARLERDRMTIDVPFLVSIETRPEIRKVFPGGAAGRTTASAARERSVPARPAAEVRTPQVKVSSPAIAAAATARPAGAFAVQAAAFDDPQRARLMVDALTRKGFDAYLVEPPASDPDAPYRVRIGRYATRSDANRAAAEATQITGEKMWVTAAAR